MATCPNCGAQMRLVYNHAKDQREWQCGRGFSLTHPCPTTIAIHSDDILPIADMALAMIQQPFSSSNERRKDQANWRRIAGGLRATLQSPFLASPERRALRQAIEVLGRLGDAAEQAKRTKVTEEQETKERDKARRKLARDQLAKLRTHDLVELAISALALHQINHRHQPWHNGWTTQFQSITALTSSIEWHFDDGLSCATDRIAWDADAAPVADLAERLCVRVNMLRAELTSDPRIAELRHYLAVEQAGNVVRLGPPRR